MSDERILVDSVSMTDTKAAIHLSNGDSVFVEIFNISKTVAMTVEETSTSTQIGDRVIINLDDRP